METTSEKKSEKQAIRNGSEDFEILRKDEAFWHRTLKSLKISEIAESAENETKSPVKHPEKVFSVHCKCPKCLLFRKLLIGIHVENEAYNDLWEKLKEILVSYYKMLPNEQDSIITQKYQQLQTESCGIRFFSDGSIDVKKNIHVSMGNYFSLSNEMTFIIVFNMLIQRDRHQLFELLCLQLTSIILAYREGIKEMTRCMDGDEEYYKPEEFLNYILNGYDRITEIADTLTPLVIEMREHLQRFSLTWQLMNQCMYYRFLYVDIESRMADCILRLKDAVDTETYKSFVYRFIKFDEEMTQIGQVWEVALVAVELYRKSQEQVSRVERIGMIREIAESLCELKSIPDDAKVNNQALALDWIVSSEKEDVWMGVLNSMKNKKHYKSNKQRPCQCWACQMADGNTVPEICAIPELPESKKLKPSDDCYHLGWAVFKHLKDREPYTKQFVNPEVFCIFNNPQCQLMECQVAINVIIGSYPLSFTKFLLRTYQPLSTNDREKFLKVPSQSLIRKFCLKKGGAAAKEIMQEADEINHSFLLLNMFWDDDDIADPMLRAGLAAALAENFKIEVKFPQKYIMYSFFYALFRTAPNGDVVMDLEWLEKVNISNLFKSFGVISNSIHDPSATVNNATNTVEAIEMTLNELKITAEVSSGSSNALDLVQFSMKEVADKLSSISLTDENSESAKKVLENEIKKPLVEALKLAASNKKLEAELKSLQKEHNMLKDMVKGLEQIHGEKKEVQVTVTASKPVAAESAPSKCGHSHPHHSHSQSGSSSPSISDADHGKDSGNGADCVCYYCTLFGKNQDLMNSRSTETRDRLRKRLHQLQNQKDFSNKSKNLKNISLLLKNGAAAKAASASTPSPAVKCPDSAAPHKCSNGTATPTAGASMKMKVELELQQRKKKVIPPKPSFLSKPVEVKIQRATEINLKSLENLVEYIEGPSSKAVAEQKKADEAAVKKQQKKAKQLEQKIRRQIESQIEVLAKINSDLQETIIDCKQVQNQLSQLKSAKSKNKESRKVKTVEEKLADLNSKRARVENEAKKILMEIKELNPSIDLHEECSEMKNVSSLLPPQPVQRKPDPVPTPIRPQPVQLKPPPQVQIKAQQVQLKAQQVQPKASQLNKSDSQDDPAKRMVTIRRINLPHAEPQVTVTAKGTTPDMDQLLYTFVNGQLVPASSLSPSAFQNGSIQLFMSSNGQTKMVVDGIQQQAKVLKPKSEAPAQKAPEKGNKKQTAAAVEKPQEKPKKKKKEEQPPAPQPVKKESKKEVKKVEARKVEPPQEIAEKKKKVKKAYIDPEFSSNPFKLLDDEEPSESEESSVESFIEAPEPEIVKDDDFKSVKKQKDEKKSNKKQATSQPVVSKPDKATSKKADRKNSVTSVASSSTSKDSKASKKSSSTTATAGRPIVLNQGQLNTSSIMDQLNRGVRVEGLRLPPGITLTKVPSEAVGAKRESINRITQPMQDFSAVPQKMPEVYSRGQSNGIIMVESNPHAQNAKPAAPSEPTAGKKKNKKKKAKSEASEDKAAAQQQERMVTLKNPMFYNNPTEPMNSMMRNLQTPPFVSPMAEPHTASIVRNENGMYTIRNPSFQNIFGGSTAAPAFVPRPQAEPDQRPYSSNQFAPFENDASPIDVSQPKCSSVIGSEMKNVLQRRKQEEYAASNSDPYGQYGMRQPVSPAYSHFGSGMNFNGTQRDDTNFMSQQSSNSFQSYQPPMMTNYDDLRLQPGQMLNSEVTIHNVTESKMFQNQAKKTPPPIGTPRNGNIESVNTLFGDLVITRPNAPHERLNGNDMFISPSNMKTNELESDHENETIRRFDFNQVPPKQPLKAEEGLGNAKKVSMMQAIGDEFAKRQNSTNSNSPISVSSSLDEIFDSNDQKHGNLHQQSSFYSTHHNFGSDDKSSGASSLFSSGM